PLLIRKIPTPHTMIITAQGVDRNPDLKHGLVLLARLGSPSTTRVDVSRGCQEPVTTRTTSSSEVPASSPRLPSSCAVPAPWLSKPPDA
ncbi:hypothetical protein ABZY44_05180, partial [Streptomyces sp. NPDC006544]|uniref:hypothetical protein n=1 Tax=Streptomyces sp. NPDC006544 TaxID=3154583 RepID=UPI0033B6F3BF